MTMSSVPVVMAAGTVSFYDHLQKVRHGEVDTQCMAFFNRRHRTHLSNAADNRQPLRLFLRG